MPVIRAQVRLKATSGLAEDDVINTWHYEDTSASPSTNSTAVRAAFTTFYQAIDTYLSDYLSNATNACETELYNLDDPTPRQPFGFGSFTLTPSTAVRLPPEISCCLSFRGDYTSGTPNARRRGRVYIGPLIGTTNNDGTFDTGFITALLNNGEILADTINALSGASFGIWSPTGSVFTPATRMWVDNGVDIQRRRGQAATSRVEVAI